MSRYVKMLAFPAGTAAVGAILWVLVGVPAWRELPGIRRELAERRGKVEAWSSPRRGEDELQQRDQRLRDSVELLAHAGAPEGQALEVIIQLERGAAARHVTQRLQLGDPEPLGRTSWKQSTVNLEVVGRLDDVAAFLDDVRRSPWLLNLDEMNLSREAEGNVRATVSGSLLWRPGDV